MPLLPTRVARRTTIALLNVILFFALIEFPFSASSFSMLRVASWNLLAQEYVKEYKYPWTKQTPGCLDWDHRKSLIVDQLLDPQAKADVFCLQEAQVDLFEELLSSLSPVYSGVIQNVTRGHNVGTAVLVRNSCNLRIKRAESRSRALIMTLEDEESQKNLYICSVHLDAQSLDPKMRELNQKKRHDQLKSLLKRINYACKLEKETIGEVPILVAGDFNMLRENSLFESLVEGNLSPSAQVSLNDAYLEAERHNQFSIPVYQSESLVQMGNDSTVNNELRLVKTYKGGSILDYIWTSEKLKVVDTLLFHPQSSVVGAEQWPSNNHPSDHVPIGIDFEWK